MGEELFGRTQWRLTFLYSGLLILFLSVFAVIVYGLLRYIIMDDQVRGLKALAEREQRMIQDSLRMNRGLDIRLPPNIPMSTQEDQLFLYVLGTDGEMLQRVEGGGLNKEKLLESLKPFTDAPAVIRSITLDYVKPAPDEPPGPRGYRVPFQSGDASQLRLIVLGWPVMQGDTRIGTAFVGKNVSYHYELFNWLLLVLLGLAVLFFAFALWLSHGMSKKAMIPVKQSYQRQKEFVADASHELRTPLSVLLSTIDSLEMEQSEETDPFERKLIANMKDEVKRMSRLTGDLLTLARSDTPEYGVVKERFDFAAHARQVVDAMRRIAGDKGLELKADMPPYLPAAGDPERLKQLMYILLDNAVKYTPEGGSVRVSLALEGKESNGILALSVADTGIGISQEDLPRIFDRFYRADKSRSRSSGGHGLGLSIAKWIVDSHNGTIKAVSIQGEGTAFLVTLPAV